MFWKIHLVAYAFVTSSLTVVTLALGSAETLTWDVIASHAFDMIGLAPLYGHAFAKPIGIRGIWGALAFAMLLVNVILPTSQLLPYWSRLSWDQSRPTLILAEIFALLLAIYFIAVIRYVFFMPKLWQNQHAKEMPYSI